MRLEIPTDIERGIESFAEQEHITRDEAVLRLIEAGLTLELPDCLIAAVAVRLNRPLVTGNTQDFQAIQRIGINLLLENWRNP